MSRAVAADVKATQGRAVAADVKATGRDRTIITKAGKRSFFSRLSEATLGTFSGPFTTFRAFWARN